MMIKIDKRLVAAHSSAIVLLDPRRCCNYTFCLEEMQLYMCCDENVHILVICQQRYQDHQKEREKESTN